MNIFDKGFITAYPTDTSFGLGIRVDDEQGLKDLIKIKGKRDGRFFSIMVKNWDMLEKFAKIPPNLTKEFFLTPKTVLLKPRSILPTSPFWPVEKVGFRINQIPELDAFLTFPITATSANKTGKLPIYETSEISETFGNTVKIFPYTYTQKNPPSEIWDFTSAIPQQIR